MWSTVTLTLQIVGQLNNCSCRGHGSSSSSNSSRRCRPVYEEKLSPSTEAVRIS